MREHAALCDMGGDPACHQHRGSGDEAVDHDGESPRCGLQDDSDQARDLIAADLREDVQGILLPGGPEAVTVVTQYLFFSRDSFSNVPIVFMA